MAWNRRSAAAVAAVGAAVLLAIQFVAGEALAYTAAGDRLFPATMVLPQFAPGDEFYTSGATLPQTPPGGIGTTNRSSNFTAVFQKTITDRLGIVIDETWTRLDRVGARPFMGFQNFDSEIKYLAVLDQEHEFLLTLGLDREFGGTGATRAGAFSSGATTPRLYVAKGLGDLDIGYLRPLAVRGLLGYVVADSRPRPNLATPGFVVEYSISYLQSKVESFDLPETLRRLTPMTEVQFTIPAGGQSFGARTNALIAPGASYAGDGWEFAVAALVPATRATGRGIGAIAQFHLSLDFIAPDTIGRPLFAAP